MNVNLNNNLSSSSSSIINYDLSLLGGKNMSSSAGESIKKRFNIVRIARDDDMFAAKSESETDIPYQPLSTRMGRYNVARIPRNVDTQGIYAASEASRAEETPPREVPDEFIENTINEIFDERRKLATQGEQQPPPDYEEYNSEVDENFLNKCLGNG